MPGYTCFKCGAIVSMNANGLVWHLKNRHALLAGRMFTCPITCGQNGCMRTFRYSSALVKHISTVHGHVGGNNDNGGLMDDMDDGDDFLPDADPVVPNHEQFVDEELDEQDIRMAAAVFVAKMKASSSTVLSTVDNIVTETSGMFSEVIGKLKFQTKRFLQSKNIEEDDANNLLTLFDQCQNPFSQLETSHQQQKYFLQTGCFVKPREIPFAVAYHPRNNPNTCHVQQVARPVTFQYVPLHDLLKPVLESKGFMRTIFESSASNDGIMRDFQDGLFCREHAFFSNPRNIRLLLYVDECEIANPLGSKAGLHKIGVIYCTILNMPPKFRSSLCNCFLVSLYNAGDVKIYGYGPILQPLVNDIQLIRPAADMKIKMASSLIEEFPFLKDDEGYGYEAWFTPGKGIHSSTGWLEERLRNVRKRTAVRTSNLKTGEDSNNAPSKLTAPIKVLPDCNTEEVDHQGMKEWLKQHNEPSSTIKTYMERTVLNRAHWIKDNGDLPVSKVMAEYPRLFDTPGMVEMDFRVLYPDVADNLFMRFTPVLVEKLISYTNAQEERWPSYLNTKLENMESNEQKKNIAISLLPCNFPTGRSGKKRCSMDESIKSFIDAKPIGTNIPKYLDEASRSPFILVIGARENPHQVFVIIDGQGLEQPNLLKAVDVCFKLFYILDIHYPWQCYITWEFVQKVLYGIEDNKKGKTSPAVIALRAALK